METKNQETPWDAEPPRQEEGHYGEPIAKEQIGDEYWEVYTDGVGKVFVAHYNWEDGKWVKDGLDRHRPSELFNADGWPTN